MSEVTLLRYDLSHGQASMIYGPLLGMKMEALWHTSLVVYDNEYLFDGGSGIVRTCPRTTPFGLPLREESLGTTTKTQAEFEAFNEKVRAERFGGNDYELLNNNCNHYTNEAAVYLTGQGTPDDVVNMIPNMIQSPIGALLSPLLTPLVQGLMNKRAEVEDERRANGASEAEATDGGQNFPRKIPETDDRAREGPGGYGPQRMEGGGLAAFLSSFIVGGDDDEDAHNARGQSSTTVVEELEDVSSSPASTTDHEGNRHAAKRWAGPGDADDVEDVVISANSTASHHPPAEEKDADDDFVEEFKRLVIVAKALNSSPSSSMVIIKALQSYCGIVRTCLQGGTPETPLQMNKHPLGSLGSDAQPHRWLALLGYHISSDKLTASYHVAYGARGKKVELIYSHAAEELEDLETELLLKESLLQ